MRCGRCSVNLQELTLLGENYSSQVLVCIGKSQVQSGFSLDLRKSLSLLHANKQHQPNNPEMYILVKIEYFV